MKGYINIAGIKVGKGYPVFIIAEAGVNHNGSLKLAKKMVDIAKSSGANAIKFQTFKTEHMATVRAPKANYQKSSSASGSQFAMLKSLELSESDFKTLSGYCKNKRIIFLSTPFDPGSAEFLNKLKVPAFKVGSGELTNLPLLIQVAKYMKPVILSTGMADLEEVREAVRAIYSTGNKDLILLHCTSCYPAVFEDVNLKALDTLRRIFNNIPVGYSDHTEGIHIAVSAITMGACIIEKHFTLDRGLGGPDHKSSLEPEKLSEMIKNIRDVEHAMGNGIKAPARSEDEIKKVARKSIVADRALKKGIKITKDMLAFKRPGTGIRPKYLNKIVGKRLRSDIKKDVIFTWGLVR